MTAVLVKYSLRPEVVALMALTKGDLQKAVDLIIAGLYVVAYNDPEDESIMDIMEILIPTVMANAVEEVSNFNKEYNNVL